MIYFEILEFIKKDGLVYKKIIDEFFNEKDFNDK